MCDAKNTFYPFTADELWSVCTHLKYVPVKHVFYHCFFRGNENHGEIVAYFWYDPATGDYQGQETLWSFDVSAMTGRKVSLYDVYVKAGDELQYIDQNFEDFI